MTEGQTAAKSPLHETLPKDAFFGRRRELKAALAKLAFPGARMGFVGMAGVGKTRLAQEVLRGWDGEAVWVDLSATTSVNAFLAQMGVALGTSMEGIADHDELALRMGRTLARAEGILVVLDTMEQLPHVGELLATMARVAPRASFLHTSQRSGEDPEAEELVLDALPQKHGVELLMNRAERIYGHVGTRESAEALVDRLDGIPLAIELAAARTGVVSAKLLLERLGATHSLLASTQANDERHRSLDDALAWSFGLLSDAEAAALCALSVFAGGFRLEAAEHVLGPDTSLGAVELLQRLRERSLLRTRGCTVFPDELRFELLQTVQSFASSRLEEGSDADAVRRRHAEYFESLASRRRAGLESPGREALADLAQERANVLAAIAFASKKSPLCAARLVLATVPFLERQGPVALRRELVDGALGLDLGAAPYLRVALLCERAEIAALYSRFEEARGLLEEAEELAGDRAEGDARGNEALARAYVSRGRLERLAGSLDEALKYVERGAPLTAPHQELRSWALRETGAVLYHRGDVKGADEHFRRAIDAAQSAKHTMSAALAMVNHGTVEEALGRREDARRSFERALEVFAAGDFRRPEANALIKVASLVDEDDADFARRRLSLCGRAMRIVEDLGDEFSMASVSYNIGVTLQLERQWEEAKAAFERARVLFHQHRHTHHVCLATFRLGALAAESKALDDAEAAFDEAEALAKTLPPASEARAMGAQLRAVLDAYLACDAEAPEEAEKLWRKVSGVELGPKCAVGVRQLVTRARQRAEFVLARRGIAGLAPVPTLWVGPEGLWFRLSDAEPELLETRATARGALWALVQCHRERPLSSQELFERVWKGESALQAASSNRVRVVLTDLRKRGLGEVLLRSPKGYFLDDDLVVRVAEG